jgi:hypothetical protein
LRVLDSVNSPRTPSLFAHVRKIKCEVPRMASVSHTAVVRPGSSVTGRNGLVDKYFYFTMSLLILAIVVSGFSQTVDASLLHAAIPRPTILWFHGAAFSAWVLFYVLQSALVRTRNVKLHRSLGWFGAGLGVVMVPLGITTAIVMTRFDMRVLHAPGADAFMVIPFYDMVAFGTLLTLAILWRKKPDLHRRLLFIATAGLMDAAFGRFQYLFDTNLYAVCTATVMLLGVARDLVVDKRVHKVYLVALPCIFVALALSIYTWRSASPWWMSIAHSILG